jgi:hypothetical protein
MICIVSGRLLFTVASLTFRGFLLSWRERKQSPHGRWVMEKLNCWEFKRCGRELAGCNSAKDGICPASVDIRFEGVHNGICAGRACWVVAGTMCEDRAMGTFAQKYKDCTRCDFYQAVLEEEGSGFLLVEDLLDIEGRRTLHMKIEDKDLSV